MAYRDEAHRQEIYDEVARAEPAWRAERSQGAPSGNRTATNGPSELHDTAAADGIVLPTGGRYEDPNDPLVYTGGSPWTSRANPNRRPAVRRASEVYSDFYRWDSERVRSFQERAWRAGLFGDVDLGDLRLGAHDDDTFRAWASIVDAAGRSYAAGQKRTPDDFLGELERSAPPIEQQRQTIRISNPEDLRAVFRQVVIRRLGQGPDDEVLDRMVANYQAEEQRVGAQLAEGGVVTEAQSAETFADAMARGIDPLKYDARKVLSAFDLVAKMMAGDAA